MAGQVKRRLPDVHRPLVGPSAGAVAVATLTVLPLFLVGGLAVQLSDDLGVRVSALGTASAAFFGAGAITSSFAGTVAEKLGAKSTMRLALLLAGLVLLAAGVGVHSLASLLGVLVLGGVGNALAQPSVNLYLAQRISLHQQGTAYGIKQSAIPAAGMIAGLAVPVLGLTIGWRWAFVLFALPAAALAIFTPGRNEEVVEVSTKPTSSLRLPRRILCVMALGAGLAAASVGCLGVFLVSGAVEAGWGEAQAGLIFAGASGVGILGRLVSGVIADRRGARHLMTIVFMLGIGALGFVALASGDAILYAIGAPVAFGFGWGWPGLLILSVVQLSPASPAAGTALVQIGTSAGAVIGPLSFGLLIEHFSYTVAWSLAGCGLIIAAVILLWSHR